MKIGLIYAFWRLLNVQDINYSFHWREKNPCFAWKVILRGQITAIKVDSAFSYGVQTGFEGHSVVVGVEGKFWPQNRKITYLFIYQFGKKGSGTFECKEQWVRFAFRKNVLLPWIVESLRLLCWGISVSSVICTLVFFTIYFRISRSLISRSREQFVQKCAIIPNIADVRACRLDLLLFSFSKQYIAC